jgi:hypothetical protein
MAQTQVKPKTGGSWTNVPTSGAGAKTTAGISTLSPPLQQNVLHGAALYQLSGGSAGTLATTAGKYASASGVQFQWA